LIVKNYQVLSNGNIICSNKSDELVIKTKSNKPIKNVSPNIKKIRFHSRCEGNPELILDDNLTIETIDLSKKNFYSEQLENLPPQLENLYLNDWYYKKIINFPKYLKILSCPDYFYYKHVFSNKKQHQLVFLYY
jgi:hypothetical protein